MTNSASLMHQILYLRLSSVQEMAWFIQIIVVEVLEDMCSWKKRWLELTFLDERGNKGAIFLKVIRPLKTHMSLSGTKYWAANFCFRSLPHLPKRSNYIGFAFQVNQSSRIMRLKNIFGTYWQNSNCMRLVQWWNGVKF